jgi:hypothetical protein
MSNALRPGPADIDALAIDPGTSALTESPAPGPAGLTVEGPGDAALMQPFEWKRLGFLSPPRVVVSDGRRLYRVWGGTSLERGDEQGAGVFFSLERPTSRRDAERRSAIVEFGNACLFVSEFDVPPGTPMLVGAVDPGDDVHPSMEGAGQQVFIRNPWARRLVVVGAAARLTDDFGGAWVYSGEKTREPKQDAKAGWN